MPDRPWHRITCACPECVGAPREPLGRALVTLALVFCAVGAVLYWMPGR